MQEFNANTEYRNFWSYGVGNDHKKSAVKKYNNKTVFKTMNNDIMN